MAPEFAGIWKTLAEELESRNRSLVGELKTAWRELEALAEKQMQICQGDPWPQLERGRLASIEELVQATGQPLLLETLGAYRKARPQERALAAVESHRTAMEDLARRLPQSVTITSEEVAATPALAGAGAWVKFRFRFRAGEAVPLRALIHSHLVRDLVARAELDGRYFQGLAQVSLALAEPWQDLQREALKTLGGAAPDLAGLEKHRKRWLHAIAGYRRRAAGGLEGLEKWMGQAVGRAAAATLAGKAEPAEDKVKAELERWQQYYRYWSRQQRSVSAQLNLESDLANLAVQACRIGVRMLESLDHEHQQVVAELDQVIQWLERRQGEEGAGDFPPPHARLAAAEDRATEWSRTVEENARRQLPVALETIEPRWALPPRRSHWRQLEPETTISGPLRASARRVVLEGFQEAEAGHRTVVREIERAREVVDYSLELAQSEGENGLQVAREGVANALSLVMHQKEIAVPVHPLVEQKLTEATARALLVTHMALAQRRLGFLTYLARQSGKEAARQAQEALLARMRVAIRGAGRLANRTYHRALFKIGWETPVVVTGQAVLARDYLGEVLNLRVSGRDLPLIYRRLFRLAPVEDPRFLVGREAEMAAIEQARRLWESGRAVSVVLVGARGSGKTSMLNCATARIFSDCGLISSQFSARITEATEMGGFLRRLVGIDDQKDLLHTLLEGNRVIMIEELERTFLRTAGGFGGLHLLLELIAATSRHTLWILSLNQFAFRYLDAAAGLSQYFSHRINAMAVEPEDLRAAILLRHNLSGLRLEYAPPPATDPRVGKVRNLLGIHKSPEELFFASLYLQSEGVFRSAFELWQKSIERAEGGVLYLQQPVEPDFEPLIAELREEDAFTLQAIVQHGSLTTGEHARIFGCTGEQSQARLDRLAALEFVEPEPGGPGIRVRPEAGRVVRLALDRRNLL